MLLKFLLTKNTKSYKPTKSSPECYHCCRKSW